MTGRPLKIGIAPIDWARLSREFVAYRPQEELRKLDPSGFDKALVKPPPHFVLHFLEIATRRRTDPLEAVRDLYCFLLEKRYEERLNLLHFAFSIFDEDSNLPEEIIARTPFPHEEGIPSFRYHGDPDSVIVVPEGLSCG